MIVDSAADITPYVVNLLLQSRDYFKSTQTRLSALESYQQNLSTGYNALIQKITLLPKHKQAQWTEKIPQFKSALAQVLGKKATIMNGRKSIIANHLFQNKEIMEQIQNDFFEYLKNTPNINEIAPEWLSPLLTQCEKSIEEESNVIFDRIFPSFDKCILVEMEEVLKEIPEENIAQIYRDAALGAMEKHLENQKFNPENTLTWGTILYQYFGKIAEYIPKESYYYYMLMLRVNCGEWLTVKEEEDLLYAYKLNYFTARDNTTLCHLKLKPSQHRLEISELSCLESLYDYFNYPGSDNDFNAELIAALINNKTIREVLFCGKELFPERQYEGLTIAGVFGGLQYNLGFCTCLAAGITYNVSEYLAEYYPSSDYAKKEITETEAQTIDTKNKPF